MTNTPEEDEIPEVDPVEALFELAASRGQKRKGLLQKESVKVAARLARLDTGRFSALIDALQGWLYRDQFQKRVERKLAAAMDARPRILLKDSDLPKVLDEAEAALVTGKANIFQMNGRLVQLVHHNKVDDDCTEEPIEDVEVSDTARRPNGALITASVSPYRLVELLLESARWYKWDGRAKSDLTDPDDPDRRGAYVPGKPPLDVAKHLEDRGQWRLRVLRGSVEAPTLRRDGSILQKPGYDRRSQLYFDDGGMGFPALPKAPTRDDALSALARLKDVIKDFPFVPDEGEDWRKPGAARSVALSAMLTALVRRSIATAPAHAIDAPVMGTGKTKIAEIASALASGRTPTTISQGRTEEEFNKRLFSVLLAGDPVIIIDNIEQEIASDEFCSVLTSESVQNRILGLSQMATVATNSLFILNGNRMAFRGDITVRVIVCNLDARMEDPSQRTFDRDPVAYTIANRPELVAAGLTVLRAHAAAGFPGMAGQTPSRFPDWDRMVRGALIWMDEPDPYATRSNVIAIDSIRDGHSTLLHAWKDAIGIQTKITTKDVIERSRVIPEEVDDYKWPADTVWPDEAADALAEAISGVLDGKAINAKRFGKYLMKFDGRPYDGLVIRSKVDPKRSNVFWLERM